MKTLAPLLRLLFILLALLVAGFVVFLVNAWVGDYRPEEKILLSRTADAPALPDSSSLDLLIWNIGYAGLDASMDFFYDGGRQMRPSEEQVTANISGISETLESYKSFDFVLLQEVDRDSKRSYGFDQAGLLEDQFAPASAFFGLNYRVGYVPIPLKEPMGRVTSGLLTLSAHSPALVERHSFPGNYSWPMNLFMLDRCFLVCRYPLTGGKELLVINTHNSAYDDGSLRRQQMAYLKDFLTGEVERGNYIIVGGDWNQSPFGLPPELPDHRFDTENLTYVEEGYPAPDWKWAYDPRTPTNRRVGTPYDRSTSLTTIIDYYLVSPNIEVREVRTVDLDFKYSDHQPVELNVRLIPGERTSNATP